MYFTEKGGGAHGNGSLEGMERYVTPYDFCFVYFQVGWVFVRVGAKMYISDGWLLDSAVNLCTHHMATHGLHCL